MSYPIVSVIIPIYNAEKYLDNCIISILNQTIPNIEVILINDGSLDNSKHICEVYEKKDNRIKYIEQDNSGVSAARNCGIDIARGTWIYFLDSDDYLESNAFEILLNTAKESNADIIQFGCNKYEDGIYISQRKPSELKDYTELKSFLDNNELKPTPAWLYFIKTELILNNNIRFNEQMKHNEDSLFIYQLCCHIKKITTLDKALHNQVLSPNSVSRSPLSIRLMYDNLTLQETLCDYVKAHSLEKAYHKELNSILKRFFTVACHLDNLGNHKNDLVSRYRNLILNNKDIYTTPFSRIALINIYLIIYPLKAIHKLKGIKTI